MSKSDNQERRGSIRFPAMAYTAFVQRLHGVDRFKSASEAAIMDFNRHGIGLCSEAKFKAGDRVRVVIKSPSEEITGISGVVKHVRQQRTEYWLGIEFDELEARPDNAEIEQGVLANLERLIKQQLA